MGAAKAILRTLVVAGLTLAPGIARADHPVPARAKTFHSSLVNSFARCFSPNEITAGLGFPACTPVAPGFAPCLLGPKSYGQVKIAVVSRRDGLGGLQPDARISLDITGLPASCENAVLWLQLDTRITSDDCFDEGGFPSSCTAQDLPLNGWPVGCTVTNGSCHLRMTLENMHAGRIPIGKRTSIEVLGCTVNFQVSGFDHFRVHRCGFLVP